MELVLTVTAFAVAQVVCVAIVMTYHFRLMNTIAVLKAAPDSRELREISRTLSQRDVAKAVAEQKPEEDEGYMPHEFPEDVRKSLSASLNADA